MWGVTRLKAAVSAPLLFQSTRPVWGVTPGAITNYLENGHNVRVALTVKAMNRSKSKKMRVVGYGFYADSKTQAKRLAIEASDELTRWVKGQLEK